ncbi:hypothetical protein RSOLAG22IIIB_10041 [Rhizoctonia solani]|uniref:Uncharacterized protein n=1 Tax=Rhizoctonia solani TaxID=456999 RepID=A0A0K6G0L6_9AGAM|nr:hypothetical protein RSOLAG22IIIB_10041 [Rhizoctonia solani]
MPLSRQHTSTKTAPRKGKLRNAAVLTLSQVTKLVNIPVAQDVARHIHQITVSLKPSVLQAPKGNDLSAKELAEHIAGLLAVLDIALPYLDMTEELDSLCSRLRGAHAELETMQASQYTTKLGSQTEIRDRIAQLKEEVYRTVLDLTLKLMIVTLAGNMRNHRQIRSVLTRTYRITMRTQQANVRQQGALVRAEQRLAISNQRIRELERLCDVLQRQGVKHETILTRYTDWHGVSYPVIAINGTLFFLNLDFFVDRGIGGNCLSTTLEVELQKGESQIRVEIYKPVFNVT